MSITTKRPPIKETVGAQYICFNTMTEDKEWTKNYEPDVERTAVVKKVTVTENAESNDVYASGEVYDTESAMSSISIEVEVIAFPADTIARMRGETVETSGLILSGSKNERPFFAYGKVVKLKGGHVRYEWFPKCKLVENSDEASTREESFSEQTDTITIKAYAFDEKGNIRSKADSSASNFPETLTEEKFFGKPILANDDLKTAIAG